MDRIYGKKSYWLGGLLAAPALLAVLIAIYRVCMSRPHGSVYGAQARWLILAVFGWIGYRIYQLVRSMTKGYRFIRLNDSTITFSAVSSAIAEPVTIDLAEIVNMRFLAEKPKDLHWVIDTRYQTHTIPMRISLFDFRDFHSDISSLGKKVEISGKYAAPYLKQGSSASILMRTIFVVLLVYVLLFWRLGRLFHWW